MVGLLPLLAVAAHAAGPDTLLMGNSYTSFHDLDARLADVLHAAVPAASEPRAVKLVAGGLRLPNHVERLDPTSGNPLWQDAVAESDAWDFVVLQDQSQVPGFPTTEPYWQASRDAAVVLDGVAHDVGAETVLLLTWGRRTGDDTNPTMFPDFTTMQSLLTDGYRGYAEAIADASGGPVWIAPVGPAFAHIHDAIVADGDEPTDPDSAFTALYEPDGSHPSMAGSTLAAHVLTTTLTGWPTTGADVPTSLTADQLLSLQEASDAVILAEPFGEWSWPWAVQWGDVVSGTPADVSLEHPTQRRHVQITHEVALEQLALSATVVHVSSGGTLAAPSVDGGGKSALRVDGGAAVLGVVNVGVEVASGSITFDAADPEIAGLALLTDGIWTVEPDGSVVTVTGPSALDGTLVVSGEFDGDFDVAVFAVEPVMGDLRVTPATADVKLRESGGGWVLAVVGADADTGDGAGDGGDGGDGDANNTGDGTTGGSGCGKAAAVVWLLPALVGWRRRRDI